MPARIASYTVIEKLAAGGMGEVYLARDDSHRPPRTLVVKRLLPQFSGNAGFVQMLFDEARIVSSLHHPNIAELYAHGVENGDVYLAMEWIDGKNLSHVIERLREGNALLPVRLVCFIIEHVALALNHAHRALGATGQPLELIHRDISPGNIMLGFDGSVKLIDFGVAKAADRLARTAVGIIKGKYPYMSPEQAAGADIDSRSDVFSLGIVLWELLTMQRLFRRKGDYETLEAVTFARIPLPSTANRDVPPELDAIVLRALARDVTKRFQTAGELAEALHVFLSGRNWSATSQDLRAALEAMFQVEPEFFPADEITNVSVPDANPLDAPTPSLEQCLQRVAATDTVSGVLFNAVEKLAKTNAKQRKLKRVSTRLFVERCFSLASEHSFEAIGARCLDALLDDASGEALSACKEADELAAELVAALKQALRPGARFVTTATRRELRLSFRNEALPISFFAGFVVQAVKRVLGESATTRVEPQGTAKVELLVSWAPTVRQARR